MEVLQPSSSSFLTQGSGQSSLHSSMLGTQLPSLASWTSRLHHARAPTPAAGTCSTSSSLPFQSSNRVAEAGSATGQAGPSSGIIPFQNYTGRSRDGDERQLPSISSILPPLRNSQIHSVRSLNLRSTPNTHHTALLSLATHSHSRHLPEGYNQSTKESKGKQAPNEEAHELETFSLLPHLQSVNDSQSRHPSRLPTRAHHFGSVAASSSAAENDVQQSNSYLSGPMSTTFSQAHTRGSTSGSATLPHLSQEPPIHSQLGLTGPQELLDLPYDGTSSFGNEYALQPLSAAFILPSSSVPSSTRSGPPSRTTGSPQLMGPPKRPATDPDSEIASGSPGYNELLSRRRTTGSRMLLLQDQLQHQHRQQRQPPVPGPQPFFLGHGGLSATPWSAGASHGAVATVGDSLQQPSYQALGPWSAHGDISRRSHVSDVRSSVSEQHQQEDRSNESRLPK
ncbi:hypothetical protein CF336_g235 [Tilletia laevis]|uniref:Uncharacterized protein n=1 Tax=Tilletia caries TaxID=13290 RepID=A0ABN7IUH1_9BASI|nr:hypothetical protein CF336_g235 [Tilletia laevis]CAD6928102.1 unnamed protein product [Tilletia caries]